MKVSLICTVLNEQSSINSLLTSIVNQTHLPDEVVIVDAGSTDQTIPLLKQFTADHPKLHLKILTKLGANRSQGRNLAIQESRYQIIAATDAGCVLDKHWLAEITTPFMNSKIDVVAGVYQVKSHHLWQKLAGIAASVSSQNLNPHNFLPSSRSIAFRKTAWETAGKFPAQLNTAEDLVFAQHLKDRGLKFFTATTAIVYWYPPANILKIFKQFYNYAFGDGLAGPASPHRRKYQIKTILLCWLFSAYFLFYITFLQALLILLLWFLYQTLRYRHSFNYWYESVAYFLVSPLLFIITFIGFWSGAAVGSLTNILKSSNNLSPTY